jgi:hypothetical protein
VLYYDRAWLARLQRTLPEVRFVDFPAFLDKYLAALPGKTPQEVEEDLVDFRRITRRQKRSAAAEVLIDIYLRQKCLTDPP